MYLPLAKIACCVDLLLAVSNVREIGSVDFLREVLAVVYSVKN